MMFDPVVSQLYKQRIEFGQPEVDELNWTELESSLPASEVGMVIPALSLAEFPLRSDRGPVPHTRQSLELRSNRDPRPQCDPCSTMAR
jgi:hypothetical protein